MCESGPKSTTFQRTYEFGGLCFDNDMALKDGQQQHDGDTKQYTDVRHDQY